MILPDWQRFELAKDTRRRRKYHLAHSGVTRGLQYLQRAEYVDLGVLNRLLDRAYVAHRGRQMIDDLAVMGRGLHRFSIAHVAFHKRRLGKYGEVGRVP